MEEKSGEDPILGVLLTVSSIKFVLYQRIHWLSIGSKMLVCQPKMKISGIVLLCFSLVSDYCVAFDFLVLNGMFTSSLYIHYFYWTRIDNKNQNLFYYYNLFHLFDIPLLLPSASDVNKELICYICTSEPDRFFLTHLPLYRIFVSYLKTFFHTYIDEFIFIFFRSWKSRSLWFFNASKHVNKVSLKLMYFVPLVFVVIFDL